MTTAAVADAYPDAASPGSTDILHNTVTREDSTETLMTAVDLSVQRRWYLANTRRRLACGGGNSDVTGCHVTKDLARGDHVASDRPFLVTPRDVITQRRLFSSAAFMTTSRSRTTIPAFHKGVQPKRF